MKLFITLIGFLLIQYLLEQIRKNLTKTCCYSIGKGLKIQKKYFAIFETWRESLYGTF